MTKRIFCMAAGCSREFRYFEDAAMLLACNLHFRCEDCVYTKCRVCVCDNCGGTLDKTSSPYSCGCSYHFPQCVPPGSNSEHCAWCSRDDGRYFSLPGASQDAPRPPQGLVNYLVSLQWVPWQRSVPPAPSRERDRPRPTLSSHKMRRRGWTAQDLVPLRFYRGDVIHNANFTWAELTEFGFTPHVLFVLGVPVEEILNRYIQYMSKEDPFLERLVQEYKHTTLYMVSEALRIMIEKKQLVFNHANFMQNLHLRVSEPVLQILYQQGNHVPLLEFVPNRDMWRIFYPLNSAVLLPPIEKEEIVYIDAEDPHKIS